MMVQIRFQTVINSPNPVWKVCVMADCIVL